MKALKTVSRLEQTCLDLHIVDRYEDLPFRGDRDGYGADDNKFVQWAVDVLEDKAYQNYEFARSNGGHVAHIKSTDKHAAICGYAPSSPNGFLIRGRGRWINSSNNDSIAFRRCPKCEKRLEKINMLKG